MMVVKTATLAMMTLIAVICLAKVDTTMRCTSLSGLTMTATTASSMSVHRYCQCYCYSHDVDRDGDHVHDDVADLCQNC